MVIRTAWGRLTVLRGRADVELLCNTGTAFAHSRAGGRRRFDWLIGAQFNEEISICCEERICEFVRVQAWVT